MRKVALTNTSRGIGLVCLIVTGLFGCVAPTYDPSVTQPKILDRNKAFHLVELAPSHSYADALQRVDSSESVDDLILINGERQPGESQLIAVPRQPTNISGVSPYGYRIIPILCYHQFTEAKTAGQRLEVTAEDFRAQLQYLADNQYNVLTLAEVEAILAGQKALPPRAVVLTIDDGYRSVYNVALPIIQEFGFPFTLYVYTDFVGGGAALTWAQVKALQETGLVDIQSHSKTHTSLSRLEQDSQEESYRARVAGELSESKRVLERRVGNATWQISYPYGNTSEVLPELMEAQGYRLGLTVTRGDNAAYADPHFLYRTMIYGDHSLEDFKKLARTFRAKNLK